MGLIMAITHLVNNAFLKRLMMGGCFGLQMTTTPSKMSLFRLCWRWYHICWEHWEYRKYFSWGKDMLGRIRYLGNWSNVGMNSELSIICLSYLCFIFVPVWMLTSLWLIPTQIFSSNSIMSPSFYIGTKTQRYGLLNQIPFWNIKGRAQVYIKLLSRSYNLCACFGPSTLNKILTPSTASKVN